MNGFHFVFELFSFFNIVSANYPSKVIGKSKVVKTQS
jgi:hypothetical protein